MKKYKQLGDGTSSNRKIPSKASLFGDSITQIAAGSGYTLLLKKNGSAFSIGKNNVRKNLQFLKLILIFFFQAWPIRRQHNK